ncbi:insulin gene enhancer protein ISL-1-like [Rhopilema esculentum]|uniref:insulin gene enhancer protein ISL-1-like n=1 Tax=Rhopilema esculentum TaxID=499914 RepID=UPI0031D7994B|eukprot:gene5909-11248_t
MAVCHGCDATISDEYIFRVAPDLQWHSSCLRCSICNASLSSSPSCFVKNSSLFCRDDYEKEFAIQCRGCNNTIEKNSLVMKAQSHIFHVDCFACVGCSGRLSPGDQFSVSSDGLLFCQSECCIQDRVSISEDSWSDVNSNVSIGTFKDTASSVDLETSPMTSNSDKEVKIEAFSKDSKGKTTNSKKNSKDKPTRVRTVLNEKQLSTLKRCYAANPRPDSVMKEQLVDLTGLSSRVIRVWFQNKRCKDKKKMMLNGGDGGKIGDILQNRMSIHSSSINDEISLPGCSPPLPVTVRSLPLMSMSSHVASSYGRQHSQDLRLMAAQPEYREAPSFADYNLWNRYDNFDYPYHQEGVSSQASHYQQLVS